MDFCTDKSDSSSTAIHSKAHQLQAYSSASEHIAIVDISNQPLLHRNYNRDSVNSSGTSYSWKTGRSNNDSSTSFRNLNRASFSPQRKDNTRKKAIESPLASSRDHPPITRARKGKQQHERRQFRQEQQRQQEKLWQLEQKQHQNEVASLYHVPSHDTFNSNSNNSSSSGNLNAILNCNDNNNNESDVKYNEEQAQFEVAQLEAENGDRDDTHRTMSTMPPPSQEMTNLILRQRQDRLHDLRVTVVPTACHNFAEQEGGRNQVTHLSDGTQIYATLPFSYLPFSSLSIGEDNCNRDLPGDFGRCIEREEEEKDNNESESEFPPFSSPPESESEFPPFSPPPESESNSSSFSPSPEKSLQHTIEKETKKNLLFVQTNSNGPLARSSCLTGTEEGTENEDNGNNIDYDTIEDQRYIGNCGDEYEKAFATTGNVENTIDDSVIDHSSFSLSSSPPPCTPLDRHSSVSPITPPPDDVIENDNENNEARDTIVSQHETKRKENTDSATIASKRKRREEELLSEEDRPGESSTEDDTNNSNAIIRFQDIIGHQSVKLRLDEVLLPLALPPTLSKEILKGIRSLPTSILFYGPPGCGKVRISLSSNCNLHYSWFDSSSLSLTYTNLKPFPSFLTSTIY